MDIRIKGNDIAISTCNYTVMPIVINIQGTLLKLRVYIIEFVNFINSFLSHHGFDL